MTIAPTSRSLATVIFITALSSLTFNSVCVADTPAKSIEKPVNQLPPLEAGVSELSFADFFHMPIGPLGPQPSTKLQQLNGKKIRITGHMAKEEEPVPGLFLLAALPVNIAEKSDGPADDLPAATLFVHMPKEDADKLLAYRAGPWVLTGTLQLGNQEESNGRTSYARLLLDKKDFEKEKNQKTQKRISQN